VSSLDKLEKNTEEYESLSKGIEMYKNLSELVKG
jgi:hypothetical protein